VSVAKKWAKFPHADPAYTYAGPALKKAWPRLHRGDCEAFPKDAAVADAWRQFHAGAFHEAMTAGRAAGDAGINAAVKAQCVYAHYVEPDAKARIALFEEAAQWAGERRAAAPRDANAHYLYALALGRYGQGISVAKALAQGFGGKIRDALTKALELDAKHAEAAAAFGAYQSEVIDKVGGIVAGLTYGAKKESALKSFEQAVKLFPESAIVHVEYANGLILLFGKSRIDDATRLYEKAAACTPADAMERLDVELAKSELE
jgi:tetratricopeptide (TPR) repeat protein